MREKLMIGLSPTRLDVVNESHLHAGHASSPGTGESHFRVLIVAEAFAGSSVEALVLGGEPGAASALKMAYAAWTKGTAAMLLAIRATARATSPSCSRARSSTRACCRTPSAMRPR